ncbi:hypothetical protein Tco_0375454 [Tanacetum coccineum]
MYGFKECSSYEALYNKSRGCYKEGFVDKFVHDPNKTPDSSQLPPHNCPNYGNPVDGLYCRQCALLRKKLEEVWFTICDENEIFQDFLNTSESSNDNTNVVNAPQSGPRLVGTVLIMAIIVHRNFRLSLIRNHVTIKTLMSSYKLCQVFIRHAILEIKIHSLMIPILIFLDDSPNPPPQPPTYSYEFCGNDAHYGHDFPPQVPFIYNLEPCYNQDFNFPHLKDMFTSRRRTDKVVLIKEKLKAARDRQKSYTDNRRKPLEFEVGDQVLLKVFSWKGVIRFGKKGKLAPRESTFQPHWFHELKMSGVMTPYTRKKFHWGIVIPTGLKRYTDLTTGLRMKRTNRKCRIPIDLYMCRVEEKLIMRKLERKWIMKKEMRMISKDGTISEFPEYTSSKEEDEEEEEEEEKEESEKKGSKRASEMGSNSESFGYAASDNEVESDLESTARIEPKCKEMEDTCESGVRPKPNSS